jgi:hypothetical protein
MTDCQSQVGYSFVKMQGVELRPNAFKLYMWGLRIIFLRKKYFKKPKQGQCIHRAALFRFSKE